jgi:hypothetical protein
MAQVLGESVEALFPEGAVVRDPVGGGRERFRIDTAVVDPPLAAALEESCLFENPDVLRDGGQRDIEGPGEVGDPGLSEGQPREDGPPGRVRKGREGAIERPGIVNH